jgi:hypothetical protein
VINNSVDLLCLIIYVSALFFVNVCRSRKVSTSESPRGSPASPRVRTTSESEVLSPGGGGSIIGSPPAQQQQQHRVASPAKLQSRGGGGVSGSEDEAESAAKTTATNGLASNGGRGGPSSLRQMRLPPRVHRTSVTCATVDDNGGGLPATPLLESSDNTPAAAGETVAVSTRSMDKITELDNSSEPISLPVAKRSRKLTETSSLAANSAPQSPRPRHVSGGGGPVVSGGGGGGMNPTLIRRKAEHRRRFMDGVPERRSMTIFDLIYYNPANGSRMANASEEATADKEQVVVDGREAEEVVDNPEEPPPPPAAAEVRYRTPLT